MSAGSFCRSPSIGTMTEPFAASKLAAIAAVWPKLRISSMMVTRSSCFVASRNRGTDWSCEPSLTKMAS